MVYNPRGTVRVHEPSPAASQAAGGAQRERREVGMPMASPHVRHNYLAIAVATVACFLFEALWYSLFLDVWLHGIGHDRKWLQATGATLPMQCVIALVAEGLIAGTISGFMQLTGPTTPVRGIRVAVCLWLGCVFTTIAVADVIALRSYASFAVNSGFWLIGMVLMGAIVGAWKKAGTRE